MEAVKAWAIALCAAAIGCSLLRLLAPQGGMGKLMKLLLAAFFLCCLLAPLLSARDLIGMPTETLPDSVSGEVLQQRVEEQFQRQMDAALLRVTNDTLKNYGTQAEKVEVRTDTSADGSICISSIVVYLDKENLAYAITAKQVMEQRLEIPCVVQQAD